MISSLRKALQDAASGQTTPSDGDAALNLTRGDFLRVAAAGAVAAGLAASPVAAATKANAKSPSGGKIAPVTDIDKLYDVWQERLNTGDIDGLVDLYMEDVTYISPAGILMTGKDKVREDFVGLFAIKPTIVLGNRRHYVWQDIALTTNHWRMNFVNGDGAMQELTGGGIEVMRKDPRDGGWRYIIDDASRSAR